MNSRQTHHPASEEPEAASERDIPADDGAYDDAAPRGARNAQAAQRGAETNVEGAPGDAEREAVAGRESIAGEEDPGAALDTEPDAPDAPDADR